MPTFTSDAMTYAINATLGNYLKKSITINSHTNGYQSEDFDESMAEQMPNEFVASSAPKLKEVTKN